MMKRNRNGSGLVASYGKLVRSILAAGTDRGIITTEGRTSITSTARLPPISPSLPLVVSEAPPSS